MHPIPASFGDDISIYRKARRASSEAIQEAGPQDGVLTLNAPFIFITFLPSRLPSDRLFTDTTYYVQTVGDCQAIVTQSPPSCIQIKIFALIFDLSIGYNGSIR